MKKNIDIIYKEEKLKIPIEIVKINFRSVTKHSNLGLNIEYIVKNEEIGIIGRGSKEGLAMENFKKEFCEARLDKNNFKKE